MDAKLGRQFKAIWIFSNVFEDSIRAISQRVQLMMLALELLVQQEPHTIFRLKRQGCSLLVMPLFGTILGCLQSSSYLSLALRNGVYKMMRWFLFLLLMCKPRRGDRQWHLKGCTWLKPKANLKRWETSWGVCCPIVTMLNDVQICIPLFVFGKVAAKWVNQSTIDNFGLSICLWVEGSGETKLET